MEIEKRNQIMLAILIGLIFILGIIAGFRSGYYNGEVNSWNDAMVQTSTNLTAVCSNGILSLDSNRDLLWYDYTTNKILVALHR